MGLGHDDGFESIGTVGGWGGEGSWRLVCWGVLVGSAAACEEEAEERKKAE